MNLFRKHIVHDHQGGSEASPGNTVRSCNTHWMKHHRTPHTHIHNQLQLIKQPVHLLACVAVILQRNPASIGMGKPMQLLSCFKDMSYKKYKTLYKHIRYIIYIEICNKLAKFFTFTFFTVSSYVALPLIISGKL